MVNNTTPGVVYLTQHTQQTMELIGCKGKLPFNICKVHSDKYDFKILQRERDKESPCEVVGLMHI